MQNWKIKRMGEKRIGRWICSVNLLLSRYRKEEDFTYCPLCTFCSCDNCLWKIFENKDCADFKKELGLQGDFLGIRNEEKWRSARIPMLRRWKKILKAELKRRKDD